MPGAYSANHGITGPQCFPRCSAPSSLAELGGAIGLCSNQFPWVIRWPQPGVCPSCRAVIKLGGPPTRPLCAQSGAGPRAVKILFTDCVQAGLTHKAPSPRFFLPPLQVPPQLPPQLANSQAPASTHTLIPGRHLPPPCSSESQKKITKTSAPPRNPADSPVPSHSPLLLHHPQFWRKSHYRDQRKPARLSQNEKISFYLRRRPLVSTTPERIP